MIVMSGAGPAIVLLKVKQLNYRWGETRGCVFVNSIRTDIELCIGNSLLQHCIPYYVQYVVHAMCTYVHIYRYSMYWYRYVVVRTYRNVSTTYVLYTE